MITHVVMWKFQEKINTAEREEIAGQMKTEMEDLCKTIPRLHDFHMQIHPLAGSNTDILLTCTFETLSDLESYQTNPSHLAIKKNFSGYFASRSCMDY